MSPDLDLATRLQKLFDLEPALTQELQQTGNLDQAIQLIVSAGSRHGIEISGDQINTQLQALHHSITTGELNDEQLAGVDGGLYLPIDELDILQLVVKHANQLPNTVDTLKKVLKPFGPITINMPPINLK